MKFNVEAPIWLSKQRILCTLNQSLKDVLNYGLFQPAYNGKAGKFLDEQRTLMYLEFNKTRFSLETGLKGRDASLAPALSDYAAMLL